MSLPLWLLVVRQAQVYRHRPLLGCCSPLRTQQRSLVWSTAVLAAAAAGVAAAAAAAAAAVMPQGQPHILLLLPLAVVPAATPERVTSTLPTLQGVRRYATSTLGGPHGAPRYVVGRGWGNSGVAAVRHSWGGPQPTGVPIRIPKRGPPDEDPSERQLLLLLHCRSATKGLSSRSQNPEADEASKVVSRLPDDVRGVAEATTQQHRSLGTPSVRRTLPKQQFLPDLWPSAVAVNCSMLFPAQEEPLGDCPPGAPQGRPSQSMPGFPLPNPPLCHQRRGDSVGTRM